MKYGMRSITDLIPSQPSDWIQLNRFIKYYILGLLLRFTWTPSVFTCFSAVLIRLLGQTKISLLLKIQWRQHHYSYTKIVYHAYNDARQCSKLKG